MIVNVLANMAIIFMDIYLVWRWRYGIEERRNPINNRKLFISLQTAAGFCLMMSSFLVEGVRFDFRSVLFAYTMVYLDKEIAALRQIGLMSNICQVIIRLPGFLYTLFHYSFLTLYYAFKAALRLLVLPVFHLDIACSSLIF